MREVRGRVLAGASAARDLPAGRTSTRRYRQHRGRSCGLPHLVPERTAPVGLVVAVLRSDAADELVQGITRTARTNHDRSVIHRHLDGIALVKMGLACNRFRKTQPQTVAPF